MIQKAKSLNNQQASKVAIVEKRISDGAWLARGPRAEREARPPDARSEIFLTTRRPGTRPAHVEKRRHGGPIKPPRPPPPRSSPFCLLFLDRPAHRFLSIFRWWLVLGRREAAGRG
jgi:hypothetical protein